MSKLPADQFREIESYACKVVFVLVCCILLVTNASRLLGDRAPIFPIIFVAATLAMAIGCWMSMIAAWALLGFGKLWKWLLTITLSVFMISLLLSVPSVVDEVYLASSFMACILAFLGSLPFFLGAWAVLRWRNWRLTYQCPHSQLTAILVPHLRWSILDMMVVTGIVAVTIATLSLCHRTLENRDGGMFGPFFVVAILFSGTFMLLAVSIVTVVPPLIIGMNHRTATKQKLFRLTIHFLLVSLVAISLCFFTDMVLMSMSIAIQFFWSFVALPRLIGFDKPGWLRFGLIRMSRTIKQVSFKD